MSQQQAVPALSGLTAATEPLVWSFIGDSVTAAARHTWGARGYSELVHERLREVGRTRDGVVTTAVSGWRVTDLLEHLDTVCLRYSPDVVVVGIGLNDTRGLADGVSRFGEDYARMIDRVRGETGAVVVVQTPNDTLPTAHEHVVEHLDAYAEEIRRVAAATGAPLVDHLAEWRGTDVASTYHWLGHGCHPNAYGHRAMARTLLRAFDLWDPSSPTGRLTIP